MAFEFLRFYKGTVLTLVLLPCRTCNRDSEAVLVFLSIQNKIGKMCEALNNLKIITSICCTYEVQ